MRKTEEISNFFFSQYFADGIRITLGCIIPVIICVLLGHIVIGSYISLGALLVGLADTPGAPSHRRTGMICTGLLCILTYLIVISAENSMVFSTVVIALLSFAFSMFAVFNSRAATVGSMCILMMIINLQGQFAVHQEVPFLIFFMLGGAWYLLISISITQIKPYRLAQQELAETIQKIGDFIRIKAKFYDAHTNYDTNYLHLIEKQIEINQHQINVRDLLFQSKRSIKDTTKVGRFLTLIFTDITDLFEQSHTTQYDYKNIQEQYAHTSILAEFSACLIKIASELDHISVRLNADKSIKPLHRLADDLDKLKGAVDRLNRTQHINTIPLKKIIINIRTIITYLDNIYRYSLVKSTSIKKEEIDAAKKFIQPARIDWKIFRNNISLDSSHFRHALRMSIVLSASYLILNLIDFSTNGIYWVLLTIMVILKPGFGLTKERNFQRLIGTFIGGAIGAVILLTIHDETIRFALLIFFFLTAYSLFRVNYIVAVLFMTPYVLIMLSFNGLNTFEMAQERIFDTFLGGMIAFLSSYVIFPNWESFQFRHNMRDLLIANYKYLAQALQIWKGQALPITEYKLARKEVYIASANMASTFQRMLTEPKWRQKNTKDVNRFVIYNHILTSHAANLMTQFQDHDPQLYPQEHLRLMKKILHQLEYAIALLPVEQSEFIALDISSIKLADLEPNEDSILITEQLLFLSKIAIDIHKITEKLTTAPTRTTVDIKPATP